MSGGPLTTKQLEAVIVVLRDRLFATMETAHNIAGNPGGVPNLYLSEDLFTNTVRNADVLIAIDGMQVDPTIRNSRTWLMLAEERRTRFLAWATAEREET